MDNEWYNGRLGHALSFLAANFCELQRMLKFIPSEDNLTESDKESLSKVGLLQVKSLLETEDGKNFLAACEHVNINSEGQERAHESIKEAATVMLQFLTEPKNYQGTKQFKCQPWPKLRRRRIYS